MGCYLAPDDTSTIERVVKALISRPKGAELLVAGDLHANIVAPEGDRVVEDIAATIATEGLEDMAQHFLPREHKWCRDWRTGGALERKGGAVPDRLHPGDGPRSLWEFCRPGPSAQLGPLPGPGLPAERPPDGAQEIPGR